jgi:hypothetical protein
MNRNHISQRASSKKMRPQFLSSGNSLGIMHTESYWDKNRKQIVYIIKTSQMVAKKIDVNLKDDMVTLEAPLVSSFDKVSRTEKVGKKMGSDEEEGLTVTGFSEFRLKPGYQYTLLSSQVINPNLIRVVLGFKPDGLFRNN